MTNRIKYLLLIIVGFIVILISSLFQYATLVKGEYHYSKFLQENYPTIPSVIIFIIIGFSVGYFWRLNPWITGFCLFFIFPLTSLLEGAVYRGSHNLLPFEFAYFFVYSLPSIIAAYIGIFIFKQVEKRREKNDNRI